MAAVAGSVIFSAGVAAGSGGDTTTPDASAALALSTATVTKTAEPAGGARAQSTVTATATETVKKRVLRTVTATVTERAKSSNLVGGGGGDGTDPRFSYCYEAIDAGYGPYARGVDPEYVWYRDADGDGVVCES